MRADGHFIRIATKHHVGNWQTIDGYEVFDGLDTGLVNIMAEEEKFDVIMSAMDTWTLEQSQLFKKWTCINFLDVEFIYPKMIENLKGAQHIIAITDHGKREMERAGFKTIYAPLGTDTKLFSPDEEKRKAERLKRHWDDDTFVVGMVGLNYGTDRKNIIGLIRAFQGFHGRHPNTKLYLHTDMMGNTVPGMPLKWVAEAAGFESKGVGAIEYAHEMNYHLWKYTQEDVSNLYRAFDVFCLASHGEGFGFPWLESQAAGCPAVTNDTTSGKELNFGGYLIPTVEDYYKFSTHYSWYIDTPPSAIDEQLELAYQDWANPDKSVYQKRKEAARKGALEYDWDTVYDKYWRPMLKEIEVHTATIPMLPKYGIDFYDKFAGKALMLDCWGACKNFQCKKLKSLEFPMLPGEWEGPQPMLQRIYPFVIDRNGKLMLDTACSLYKWLSPRFIKEVKKYSEELWSYPKVRESIKGFWDGGKYNGKFIPLDSMPKVPKFDDGYKIAWQTCLFTPTEFDPSVIKEIPKGAKILDVGCGDARRIKKLNEVGYDAMGTEINPAWIDEKLVVYGDVNNLPFPDDSFDAVMSFDVLEHMEDPLKGLSEMFRVSKEYVVLQVTPTDVLEYWEDPTHIVEWASTRWQRELMFMSAEMNIVNIGPYQSVYLLKKKREVKA